MIFHDECYITRGKPITITCHWTSLTMTVKTQYLLDCRCSKFLFLTSTQWPWVIQKVLLHCFTSTDYICRHENLHHCQIVKCNTLALPMALLSRQGLSNIYGTSPVLYRADSTGIFTPLLTRGHAYVRAASSSCRWHLRAVSLHSCSFPNHVYKFRKDNYLC